ncbi:MarR family winged helix-turn-helix transcriptional regulator [Neobacillus mesonae]|uniref:MarR family winged helix-turn-helix transcriptional regulator n=1 Tax=Neobacillus mesonae TaxID=1193713 RepID=UPI00203A5F79|nr:MarR family transcriptional regulator [Neobacillus mesonae]MCM3568009.1 MarR family transcriptional regulator [Neobacillus mesonae]
MDQSLEVIELELAVLIRRITSYSTHKKIGKLDRSAYLILHQIAVGGAAGVKTLAGEFQLDISTVSRQAAALEHKGYLYKIPDPTDGRAYTFQITELGIKELNEDKQARMKRAKEVTKNWTDEERETFGTLLKKFNQAAIDV